MFRDLTENMFRGLDRKCIMLECLLFSKVQQGRAKLYLKLACLKTEKIENTAFSYG